MKQLDAAMEVLTEKHSMEEQRNYTGSFCGFVLLDAPFYDLFALAERLRARWNIVPMEAVEEQIYIEGGVEDDWLAQLLAEETVDVLTKSEMQNDNLIFDIPGAMVTISFMPEAIPDGEAERFAAVNKLWPDAVIETKRHTAHLMVAVLPRELAPVEAGKVYVKILSSCLEAAHTIGVYTSGTVLEPSFYQQVTAQMEQGMLPIENWIQFGTYQTEQGNCGYTIGMDAFGRDELEILGSQHSQEEIRAFLFQAVTYVLEHDIDFYGKNSINFTGKQEYAVQRGDGAAVEGHSIQIDF